MEADDLLPSSQDAKFLNVPYEKRWDCLKPTIVQLYMGKYGPNGKSMTTGQLVVFMREHYSFHASYVPTTSQKGCGHLDLISSIFCFVENRSIDIGSTNGVSADASSRPRRTMLWPP